MANAEVGYGLINICLLSHATADMKKLNIKLGDGLIKINEMSATEGSLGPYLECKIS